MLVCMIFIHDSYFARFVIMDYKIQFLQICVLSDTFSSTFSVLKFTFHCIYIILIVDMNLF
jgi:hypothetical protein